MKEETKLSDLRLAEIRRRAGLLATIGAEDLGVCGDEVRRLSAYDVPALLAALEAALAPDAILKVSAERDLALDALVKAEKERDVATKERDEALAEMKGERALRQALQERFDREMESWAKALEEARGELAKAEGALATARKDAIREAREAIEVACEEDLDVAPQDVLNRLLAAAPPEQASTSEDKLRARVAELEGALASARAALERLANQYEQEHEPWERPAWLTANLPPAAPPEQAPAPPRTGHGARFCGECHYSERCKFLLGPSYRAEGPCDWDPSRFRAARPADVGAARAPSAPDAPEIDRHMALSEIASAVWGNFVPLRYTFKELVGAAWALRRERDDTRVKLERLRAEETPAPTAHRAGPADVGAAPPASTGTAPDLARQGDAAIEEARKLGEAGAKESRGETLAVLRDLADGARRDKLHNLADVADRAAERVSESLAQAEDPLCARDGCGHEVAAHSFTRCWKPRCGCPGFVAPGAGSSAAGGETP